MKMVVKLYHVDIQVAYYINQFVPDLIEFANNIDPDQPQPNAAADQDLCCLALLSQDAYHHYLSNRHHRVWSDAALCCS